MPTPGSETYKSSNPLETREKSTYSSRNLPELIPGPDVPKVPTVSTIEPDTLPVPGPDTEVVLTGENFNEDSQIMWNGSAEPTTYIDPEHLSTIVKPSTVEAELPFTLPVAVLNVQAPFEFVTWLIEQRKGLTTDRLANWRTAPCGSILSDPIDFTFTEAPEAP